MGRREGGNKGEDLAKVKGERERGREAGKK